ncbi:aminoglycoside N(3)-acetyltransferase [Actinoplanes sp. CA-252034]|uniref:aminoglycoside N(3)-acetyltransferase n=1 Tax=Actinoplanes sp. CA-252034 TaxID=3239906 RepID=UPI003D97C732
MAGVSPDRAGLAADLRALGLPAGDLVVHVSLRRLGPPAGGPQALLDALREVIGPDATIVVPTHTANNSTTSPVFREAIRGMDPPALARYLDAMPGFSPQMPSYGMGAFAEHVRAAPGAVRSGHPQTSFAATGPRAADLMAVHDLDCHLGERSPVGALYRAGAYELMIGCGWERCTGLHLAESRVPQPRHKTYTCFVERDGKRVTEHFLGIDHDDRDFAELGAAFDRTGGARRGRIGRTTALLTPLRGAVDFAVRWLTDNRRWKEGGT